MKISFVSNIASHATQLARQVGTSVAVKPGDTLSALAKQHNISLQNLLDANPHKKANPDLIRPGEVITIPSSSQPGAPNTATPSTSSHHPADTATNGLTSLDDLIAKILPGTNMAVQKAHAPTPEEKTAVTGEQIANEAQSHFGKTPKELSESKELPAMKDGYGANCANFVSAVLVKLDLLDSSEHQLGVANLREKLENDKGWTSITFKNNNGEINLDSLKEGDLIFMENNFSHVEFIVKNEKGDLVAIGSNGNRDEQSVYYHTNWDWIKDKATTVLRKP